MSTVIGLAIIATVLLSSGVFLILCLLMTENLLGGGRTPRITDWFLRRLHAAQVRAAHRHGSRFAH